MSQALDTRTRLMLTAERLYAERGIGSVSLRDIGVAAGQRNASVIQYHFGPKPDLVNAVFEHRMGHVNERRFELLARMHTEGRASDLRSLVEALVRPLVAVVSEPGCYYARFLAQLSADPTYRISESWDYATSLHMIRDGLRRPLSNLPDHIFIERWRMLTHLVIHTIADHEKDLHDGVETVDDWVSRLIDVAAAVLTVPVSEPNHLRLPQDLAPLPKDAA